MTDLDAAGKKSGPRLLFIDNIRILLICLVIATTAPSPTAALAPGTLLIRAMVP